MIATRRGRRTVEKLRWKTVMSCRNSPPLPRNTPPAETRPEHPTPNTQHPMDFELIPGKVALVTGSTRGLGRAIARRLAVGGADVMLHDQDPSQAAVYGEAS